MARDPFGRAKPRRLRRVLLAAAAVVALAAAAVPVFGPRIVADRLLAATPLLMLAQMVLLPVWLRLFAGAGVVESVEMGPFISAFIWLIVVPLLAAFSAARLLLEKRW